MNARAASTPSYRRGYLAGRALARRGVQAPAETGRPRRPESDPQEYQRGYEAGLNARKRQTPPQPSWQWTPELVIEQLQDAAFVLDKVPTLDEARGRVRLPNSTTLCKMFGSYHGALVAAGLRPGAPVLVPAPPEVEAPAAPAPEPEPEPEPTGPVLLAEVRVAELLREPTDLLAYARRTLAATLHDDELSPAAIMFGRARQPIVGDDGRTLTHGEIDLLLRRELETRGSVAA